MRRHPRGSVAQDAPVHLEGAFAPMRRPVALGREALGLHVHGGREGDAQRERPGAEGHRT